MDNFDGVVESSIYAPQEVPLGCKAQWFFIPLIISGGIWNFLLSTPRAFPAGTIRDTFYESINFIGLILLTFYL